MQDQRGVKSLTYSSFLADKKKRENREKHFRYGPLRFWRKGEKSRKILFSKIERLKYFVCRHEKEKLKSLQTGR